MTPPVMVWAVCPVCEHTLFDPADLRATRRRAVCPRCYSGFSSPATPPRPAAGVWTEATGWLLLDAAGSEWVVPLAAVSSVGGASSRSVPEVAWSPLTRLGPGSALRRLSEAGEPCLVHLVDGSAHEARLARVGSDFVELTVGDGRIELVSFAAIAAVRSRR